MDHDPLQWSTAGLAFQLKVRERKIEGILGDKKTKDFMCVCVFVPKSNKHEWKWGYGF